MPSTTFSGNSATNIGGAIYNTTNTTTITNSTLSGNSSGSNGGTLYNNSATINAASNIITDGSCAGGVTDDGNNLNFNTSGCPGTVADPQLGLLQDNGGPTHTMALSASSPAIDGGHPVQKFCKGLTNVGLSATPCAI